MKKKIIKLTESDLHRIVRNSVRRILKEEYGNYDDFDSYVLVDEASEEVLGNYGADELDDAISDADSMQARSPRGFGRYLVVGCINNEYDIDNDIVYDTNEGQSYKI